MRNWRIVDRDYWENSPLRSDWDATFRPISLVLFGPKNIQVVPVEMQKYLRFLFKFNYGFPSKTRIFFFLRSADIGYLWAFKGAFQIKTFAICKWTFLLNNWRILLLYARGFWTWRCLSFYGHRDCPHTA